MMEGGGLQALNLPQRYGPLGGAPQHDAFGTEQTRAAPRVERRFSDELLAECEAICARYPQRKAALLPLLRVAEREFGEVDLGAMRLVAGIAGVSPAHVWGVFSFYTHYRRPGTGKYMVQVCRTLSCELRASKALWEHLCGRLGLGDQGGTTPDGRYTLKRVECLGSCGSAPAVQIDDDYHERQTPESIERVLAGLD